MISVDVSALKALIVDAVREALASSGAPRFEEEFLSVARAAQMAEISAGTVREWIKQGRLVRYGAGRELRVKRSDLLAFLSARPATGNDSPEDAARAAFAKKGRA